MLDLCSQSDVMGAERRGGVERFTGLLLPSKWRIERSMWDMRGFEFRLSLSLSLSLGVLVRGLLPAFWSVSTVEKFVFYIIFSFVIGSVCVFLRFLPWRSRIDRKISFNYVYFMTNLIDISLCADPMRRNPFFFVILKKVSSPIISGECSRGR